MKHKSSFLVSIKSREQLLKSSNQDPADMSDQVRKTKIVCSISKKVNNYQAIKNMILAGGNFLRYQYSTDYKHSVNCAYDFSRKQLKKLSQIRNDLEKEFGKTIGLNMMLKGKITRVISLSKPEIYLRENATIRLTEDSKIIGDENIVPIDQESFFESIKIGDKIAIDYGQVVLRVVEVEDQFMVLQKLMNSFPDKYQSIEQFRNPQNKHQISSPNSDGNNENMGDQSQSSDNKMTVSISSAPLLSTQILEEHQGGQKKIKYLEALKRYQKRKNEKKFKVIKCVVQGDCILRAFKPVFLCENEKEEEQDIGEADEQQEEMEEESQITNKDINDISSALKFGYDSITISNVTRQSQIQEVGMSILQFLKLKQIIGKNKNIHIYIRITSIQGVQNFEELISEADGCIIARAYIALFSSAEDVVKQQLDMIHACRQQLKPILISTQILESMLTQLTPSFTEMGDISNVLREQIDAVMLTGETTYGNHPIEVIKTLDRICHKIEMKLFSDLIKFPSKRDPYFIYDSETPVASAIAQSVVELSYQQEVKPRLIIVFTTTGATAIKLSKLKAVCLTVAVTTSKRISRMLNLVSGVMPIYVDNIDDKRKIQKDVIQISIKNQWAKEGDFGILMTGIWVNEGGVQNYHINEMEIIVI